MIIGVTGGVGSGKSTVLSYIKEKYDSIILLTDDIAKELKVKPFVIKKLIPYTKSYNEKQIIDILYKLSEIDSDIKLKGYDKTKVMESFLLTI